MESKLKPMVQSKMLWIVIPFICSGCVSMALSDSNDEFLKKHQKNIEFEPSAVPAHFIEKIDGAYIYGATDKNKQKVIFRLPSNNKNSIEVSLHDYDENAEHGKPAMFHFNQEHEYSDPESDYPINVNIHAASLQTGFSYSCKDGKFHNMLEKSVREGVKCGDLGENCHGLSSFDSFVLGLRRSGYVVTGLLDIASLPVTLPFALLFAFTYCGPFGCP